MLKTNNDIKRALISVSDKSGIVEFAQELRALDIEIISTGGTAQILRENKIEVIEIADYTGFPEMLGGRVKTLHPKVYGGILFRRDNIADLEQIEKQNLKKIDLVVVNLYPFAKIISQSDVSFSEAIENIDIGGPCLIRAAAKNHQFVTVLTSDTDYQVVLKEIKNTKNTSPNTRLRLASQAFKLTYEYDKIIYSYLSKSSF